MSSSLHQPRPPGALAPLRVGPLASSSPSWSSQPVPRDLQGPVGAGVQAQACPALCLTLLHPRQADSQFFLSCLRVQGVPAVQAGAEGQCGTAGVEDAGSTHCLLDLECSAPSSRVLGPGSLQAPTGACDTTPLVVGRAAGCPLGAHVHLETGRKDLGRPPCAPSGPGRLGLQLHAAFRGPPGSGSGWWVGPAPCAQLLEDRLAVVPLPRVTHWSQTPSCWLWAAGTDCTGGCRACPASQSARVTGEKAETCLPAPLTPAAEWGAHRRPACRSLLWGFQLYLLCPRVQVGRSPGRTAGGEPVIAGGSGTGREAPQSG